MCRFWTTLSRFGVRLSESTSVMSTCRTMSATSALYLALVLMAVWKNMRLSLGPILKKGVSCLRWSELKLMGSQGVSQRGSRRDLGDVHVDEHREHARQPQAHEDERHAQVYEIRSQSVERRETGRYAPHVSGQHAYLRRK